MRYVIFTLCFLIFLLAVFLFIDSVKADCNITYGYCSCDFLGKYFGDRTWAAQKVASQESSCNPLTVESIVCGDYQGVPTRATGLFQLCPATFCGRYGGLSSNLQECINQLKDPETNARVTAEVTKGGRDWCFTYWGGYAWCMGLGTGPPYYNIEKRGCDPGPGQCGSGGGVVGGVSPPPPPPQCPAGSVGPCGDGQCYTCPSGWKTECIPGETTLNKAARCVAEPPPEVCDYGPCNCPGYYDWRCSGRNQAQLCYWEDNDGGVADGSGARCWSAPGLCPPGQICVGGECSAQCVPETQPLSVSCSASPNPANVNQTVTFTANVTGGTGSYSYSWSGACKGNSSTCSSSFSSAGTYTANLTVTSGDQTKSTSCSVTVNQPSTVTQPSTLSEPPKRPPCDGYGDVDFDGYVTSVDANFILRYVAGLTNFTSEQKRRADVNGNGEIESVDALLILRYVADLTKTFNVCSTLPPSAPSATGTVTSGTCNFQATFSASPTSGDLANRFNITYGVTKSGNCDSCSGSLNVTLNLDNIKKDWDVLGINTKYQSLNRSFNAEVSGGNISFNSKTFVFEPVYHGRHNFSVRVSGNVNCGQNVKPNYINVSGSILVNPTDVISINPTVTSSPPTPRSGTYKTPLRQFIAGFQHIITYGIRLNFPYVFKLDDGQATGSMTGPQSFSASFPLQNTSGSSPITKTATFTPTLAGQYTISSCHNADDERSRAPDNECQSTTITVYRYLCYQGFCFECPREPQTDGFVLKVQEADCQAVEDIKCQTYINKSCKGGFTF
jgi:hypothetical protein